MSTETLLMHIVTSLGWRRTMHSRSIIQFSMDYLSSSTVGGRFRSDTRSQSTVFWFILMLAECRKKSNDQVHHYRHCNCHKLYCQLHSHYPVYFLHLHDTTALIRRKDCKIKFYPSTLSASFMFLYELLNEKLCDNFSTDIY